MCVASESDTAELINQPTRLTISTKKELNKAINALRQQFMELQNNQPVEPEAHNEDQPVKRSVRGRPKKDEAEKKVLDKQYFADYYRNKLSGEMQCDVCGCFVFRGNLTRHKKSELCKKHNSC